MRVVPIVEGDGEVAALPVLLRRLAAWRTPEIGAEVSTPIRVRRDRFLNKPEEFERFLLLASAKAAADGWILVLLDADDDCPATTAVQILARARVCVRHERVSVVLAKREYEAWFIAASRSLDGFRGFKLETDEEIDCEVPRNAKEWIRARIVGGSYGETTDQPAFSARMDLQQAFNRSRSFRKLCKEWEMRASEFTRGPR